MTDLLYSLRRYREAEEPWPGGEGGSGCWLRHQHQLYHHCLVATSGLSSERVYWAAAEKFCLGP